MKPRYLKTTPDVIASNYKKSPLGEGRFLHSFTPKSTDKIYQFEGSGADEITEGEHYNIGYYEKDGLNIIEPNYLSKASHTNKYISYLFALKESEESHSINKEKNDTRVHHSAESGYYWGKKYAWREFGTVISQNAFYKYLENINHTTIPCQTINPHLPFKANEDSIAYLEEGLKTAMDDLIETAEKINEGPYYKSPLYFNGEKNFKINGIKSITDKK